MARFLQFAEELARAEDDAPAVFRAFEAHARALGFFTVDVGSGVMDRWPLPSAIHWRMDHYHATLDWTDAYAGTDFQRYDRTVPYSAGRTTPWLYEELFSRSPDHPVQAQLEGTVWDQGIRSGLALPLHGAGRRFTAVHLGSGLSGAELARLDRETRPEVHLLSAQFSAYLLRTPGAAVAPAALSARERECLLWASRGKTAWETSVILSISESAVKKHLASAAAKLQVRTRTQAVAAALSQALIQP